MLVEPVNDAEQDLIDAIAECDTSPNAFAELAYSWGEGELAKHSGPRAWQRELNNDIESHLTNPDTRFMPLMIAVASGHGIGKSAEISMLINWAMSTCEDCKVLVTANTQTQLQTKTWPEIIKWTNRAINSHWFKPNATSVHSVEKGREKIWRADAVTWSVNNTEAFAGLHNQGKRILVIFDEASAIDDAVWEVTEGALTDEETEIIWIAFGNPTRNTGRFKDCFGKLKHRWIHKQIDSRTVEGTNKAQIAKWELDYGEDSDFFKVRVRGIFPSTSMKQFISQEYADAALTRKLEPGQYEFAPKILTVDPAWEGDDDFVIGLRQGLHFRVLRVIPKNDNDMVTGALVANLQDEEKADAVMIDGGYGTGIVSYGRSIGREWTLVWFSESPFDVGCANKRAEMWKLMRDWLKDGGSIEGDTALHMELTGPEAVPRNDGKLLLESKADMKGRGIASPNRADALALSFAHPVTLKPKSKPTNFNYGSGSWMG